MFTNGGVMLRIFFLAVLFIGTTANSQELTVDNVSLDNNSSGSIVALGSTGDICQCKVRNDDGSTGYCMVQTHPTDKYGTNCHCTGPYASGSISSKNCNKDK